MPLVNRANLSKVFRQPDEPADWLNGELWVDTDNANVFVNDSGTALQVGSSTTALTTEGDTLFRNATVPARLAIGAATEVYTVNAGADAPEWAAPAGGGKLVKLAETELSSAGTSLKIDGQSIEMDPSVSNTYSKLRVEFILLGDVSKTITAQYNAATQMEGNSLKIVTGTITGANFSDTSTFPISQGDALTQAGFGNIDIAVGERTTDEKALRGSWQYFTGETLIVWGGGIRLRTTASTIFTEIEIIGSGNMDAGSLIALYGVER